MREWDFYARGKPNEIVTVSGEMFGKAMREAAQRLGVPMLDVHWSPRFPEDAKPREDNPWDLTNPNGYWHD